MNLSMMLTSMLEILGLGLLFGAGTTVVFALGLRLWEPVPVAGATGRGNPVGRVAAVVCFAAVVAAVAYGVWWIAAHGH